MQSKRVRDFMAKQYATVTPDQSVFSAVKTIIEYHQSALPVIDESSQLIGLITEADCMREALVEGYYNEGSSQVKDLMSDAPDIVSPDAELSAVAEIFLQNNRRMTPVVEAGTLVGILSRKNILKALVDRFDG